MLSLLSDGAWIGLGVAAVWILLRATTQRLDVFSLAALAAVATSGLALDGWTVADEVLVFAVLIGASVGRRGSTRRRVPYRPVWGHTLIFLLLCAYLGLQAVRGMVELVDTGSLLDGLRKARWPLFFLALAWLSRRSRSAPSADVDWPRAIATIGMVYMLVYVATGMLAEGVLGIDRYSLQPGMAQYSGENLAGVALFGSSAYAMFPALVIVPAGLMLMSQAGVARAWIGGGAVGSVLLAGIYYDSRVSLLFLAVMTLAALPSAVRFNARRLLTVATVYGLLLGAFMALQPQRTENMFAGLLVTGGAAWADDDAPGSTRDIDRVTHVRAGLEAVDVNWSSFLVGYGYRMSGFVIGPYYYDLITLDRAFSTTADISNFATEGFTSLLVDGGWVGIGILILCVSLAALEIVRRVEPGERIILLAALAAAVGWLVVINMLDILLFYLLFMPNGLLVRLGMAAAAYRAEAAGVDMPMRVEAPRLRPLVDR